MRMTRANPPIFSLPLRRSSSRSTLIGRAKLEVSLVLAGWRRGGLFAPSLPWVPMSREGLYNEQVGDTERDSKITVKPDKTSSRPIRVIGLLLILQAIGLVG